MKIFEIHLMDPVISRRVSHIWVALAWLWCAIASAATSAPIQITLAPEVQVILQQTEPARKRQIDKAIKVGNAFIQRYLDGRAYNLDPEIYKEWEQDTGRLMTMSAKEFDEVTQAETSDWPPFEISDPKYPPQSIVRWQVCPAAVLEAIDSHGEKTFLAFRTKKMGYSVSSVYVPGGTVDFVADKDAGFHTVHLTVESHSRISSVRSSEKLMVYDYQRLVSGLQQFIRKPSARARIGDTKERLEAAARNKSRIVRDIENTAAAVCSNHSTTKNSSKEY